MPRAAGLFRRAIAQSVPGTFFSPELAAEIAAACAAELGVRPTAADLSQVHPSLLPAYPGLDTPTRAIAAGAKLHGCSVHWVSEGVDAGRRALELDIDLGHLTRDGGVQVVHGLHGLDHAEGLPGLDSASHFGELHEHHVAELVGRIAGDADGQHQCEHHDGGR